MFKRVSLLLASLFTVTAVAAACEPPPFPPSPDEPLLKKPAPVASPFPHVGTIVALNGKEETVEYTVVVPVAVRERIPVRPPGDVKEDKWKEVVVFRWEHKQIMRKSKLDRLKFFDASGKPVAMLDAWKQLAIGTKFFVSADGAPVPAEHLKLIAKDALVVVDTDNVLLERILQELELGTIEQWPGKLPHPGPKPLPWPELPLPRPEPR